MTNGQTQWRDGRGEHAGSGFSLVELLVVVAIILIVAGIAIPSFIRSRIAANEAAAAASLRNIVTANVVYSTTYGLGYSTSLAALGPPSSGNPSSSNAALIDSVLASGLKSGYSFTYTAGTPDAEGKINDFQLNADPATAGFSGIRHFFTDESGVIRQNMIATAGAADPPIS